MLASRLFRAASAAGVIAFSLALLMGQGRAQAAPEDWFQFVGGQLRRAAARADSAAAPMPATTATGTAAGQAVLPPA